MTRFGFSFLPGTGYAATVSDPNDPRLIAWADHLLAYYDTADGAAYSTLSPGMLATGANPALTLSGALGGRAIRTNIPVGGARGTATYAVSFDGGATYPLTGTTGATTVDLGGGTGLDFANATYAATTANQASNYYEAKVATWKDLLGNTTRYMDDAALSTSGPVYDYFGVNSAGPSLRFNGSMLANTTGIPSLLAGSSPFYIVATVEILTRPTGANALRIWAASKSGSANNSKNIISSYATGPTFAAPNALRWGNQRLDGATGSVSAYSTTVDGSQAVEGDVTNDWNPHVHEWAFDGTTFTHRIDGIVVASKSFATGTLSLDRYTWGGNVFGASAATNFLTMMVRRKGIYSAPPPDTATQDAIVSAFALAA